MKNQYYDYSISAIGDEISDEKIIDALQKAGLSEIVVEKLLNFDAFVEGLPNNSIEGFTAACDDWARGWINGGGDYSTGDALRRVCAEDTSNNPQVLARALYASIVDFTKKGFEASGLVSTLIMESMEEE